MFVVAGDRDSAIPIGMAATLAAAGSAPAAPWIIAGAGHGDLRESAGAGAFDSRLREFLDQLDLA